MPAGPETEPAGVCVESPCRGRDHPFRGSLNNLQLRTVIIAPVGRQATKPPSDREIVRAARDALNGSDPGPADPFPRGSRATFPGPDTSFPGWTPHSCRPGSRAITPRLHSHLEPPYWPPAPPGRAALEVVRRAVQRADEALRTLHRLDGALVQGSRQVRAGADNTSTRAPRRTAASGTATPPPLPVRRAGRPSGRSSSGPRSIQSVVSARAAGGMRGTRRLGVGHVLADRGGPGRWPERRVGQHQAQPVPTLAAGDQRTLSPSRRVLASAWIAPSRRTPTSCCCQSAAPDSASAGRGDTRADQERRRGPEPRDHVEQPGGEPAADRHLHEDRVQRVAEPRAVQQVLEPLAAGVRPEWPAVPA